MQLLWNFTTMAQITLHSRSCFDNLGGVTHQKKINSHQKEKSEWRIKNEKYIHAHQIRRASLDCWATRCCTLAAAYAAPSPPCSGCPCGGCSAFHPDVQLSLRNNVLNSLFCLLLSLFCYCCCSTRRFSFL